METLDHFTHSVKAVEFRKQIFRDREATVAITRKAFQRKLTEFKRETNQANESGHHGYDGFETYRRVHQVNKLVLDARNMQLDYDEEELMELLNDIIAADNTRRQATAHIDIGDYRDKGFFDFKNAIFQALQTRGYVPEKTFSQKYSSRSGREPNSKDGDTGRRSHRSANAAQATADSGDSDGDSDDDSGADVGGDYGLSSAGTRPLVGNVLEVDGDDGPLMDNDSHSDLDSGASGTMDYSYDTRDRDYYYETGGCVVYVPRGA